MRAPLAAFQIVTKKREPIAFTTDLSTTYVLRSTRRVQGLPSIRAARAVRAASSIAVDNIHEDDNDEDDNDNDRSSIDPPPHSHSHDTTTHSTPTVKEQPNWTAWAYWLDLL